MRRIEITPALNGYIVHVGCKIIVFTDVKVMTDEIMRYCKDPRMVEEEYLANAINNDYPEAETPTSNVRWGGRNENQLTQPQEGALR